MRLFVAAYPPPGARDDLAGLVAQLSVCAPREPGRSVRLVPPENWHLTLAFLGEVPESALDRVTRLVDRLTAGRPAPDIQVAGGGTFGRGPGTTLWAGVRGDVPHLRDLAGELGRALRRAHLSDDRKPFRAHVTLARPGDRISADDLAGDLARLDGYAGPPWRVAAIRVMRSHLGPRPTYDPLHEVALTG